MKKLINVKKIQRNLKKSTRKNRTLSLNNEQFEQLQQLCEEKGWKTNKVIDELISTFLENYSENFD